MSRGGLQKHETRNGPLVLTGVRAYLSMQTLAAAVSSACAPQIRRTLAPLDQYYQECVDTVGFRRTLRRWLTTLATSIRTSPLTVN